MSEIRSYRDLRVWQDARVLVRMTYDLTKLLPSHEKFCIIQQACRAAVSVPANIAEGHGSSHRRVYTNHLSIAKGSLMELETYVLLVIDLEYVREEQISDIMEQIRRVGMLLSALIRSLGQSRNPSPESPIPSPTEEFA